MSFDQRPNKIRVVADGPKAARQEAEAAKSASAEETARLGKIESGKRGKVIKPGTVAKASGKGKAGTAAGAAGTGTGAASGGISSTMWMIAGALFVLGSAAGAAAAMATIFH